MDAAVGPGICQRAASASVTTGRQLASRRGCADDRGRAPLPLARSRSRWSYPGHPRAEQAQPSGGQTILRKLLKGLRYAPRILIIDQMKSYLAAKVQIMPRVEHRQRYCQVAAAGRASIKCWNDKLATLPRLPLLPGDHQPCGSSTTVSR
jgi:hypothetical protein